jgi:hypothetical protein
VQEGRKEGVLDLVEMMQSKSSSRKCLEAKKNLMKQSIFMLLSVLKLVMVEY